MPVKNNEMVSRKSQCATLRGPVLHYMLVFLIVNIFFPHHSNAAECSSQTYNDISFTEFRTDFSPYDRIFIKIDCNDLQQGKHSLLVNWVHQKAGIVRSDKQEFTVKTTGTGHTAYFWFKLTRRGPIKSTLTNQDFYQGHMGDWFAEVVLDNQIAVQSMFTVDESR